LSAFIKANILALLDGGGGGDSCIGGSWSWSSSSTDSKKEDEYLSCIQWTPRDLKLISFKT